MVFKSGLVFIKELPKRGQGRLFRVKCKCGLVFDTSRQCAVKATLGCVRCRAEGNKTHGMWKSPVYVTWDSMKKRCQNPKSREWKHYGGRGIKVHKRWQKFENFYADMGDRAPGMTLDRIDCNGDYCKENCRWITQKEQCRNTRANVWFNIEGVAMTAMEAAIHSGIKPMTVYARIHNGWPTKDLLSPTHSLYHTTVRIRKVKK